MAVKSVKVSDLSGADGADITVVLRDYPGLDAAKALDVTPDESTALLAKALSDVLVLELRMPDSTTKEVMVKKTDLDKWMVKPEEVVASARSLRGRQPGYSPRNGNGSY